MASDHHTWAKRYLKDISENPDTPADDEMPPFQMEHPALNDPYGRVVRYPRVRPPTNAPLVFPPPPDPE
jgi:hypothetical protein